MKCYENIFKGSPYAAGLSPLSLVCPLVGVPSPGTLLSQLRDGDGGWGRLVPARHPGSTPAPRSACCRRLRHRGPGCGVCGVAQEHP